MNWLFHVVPAAIVLLLIAATVLRRDLWPFSHYPMFAGYEAPPNLRFFRLQFTLSDGEVVTLMALEPELGDAFDREFSRVWPDETGGSAARDLVLRSWRDAARYRSCLASATHASVVVRLAQIGAHDGVKIVETPLEVVEMANIRT